MKMFTPTVTGPTGQIVLDVRSDSVFLGGAVAIEVRDSRMRLVARAAGQRTMNLPAGLYEVSTVLGDGHKHSHVVQVLADQSTPVYFTPQSETTRTAPMSCPAPDDVALELKDDVKAIEARSEPPIKVVVAAPSHRQSRRLLESPLAGSVGADRSETGAGNATVRLPEASLELGEDAPAFRVGAGEHDLATDFAASSAAEEATKDLSEISQAELEHAAVTPASEEPPSDQLLQVVLREAHGAELVSDTGMIKTFRCASQLQEVPTALLDIAGRLARISLPVSPAGYTPSSLCVVRIEGSPAGAHAHAWIAPERTVANGLQNMLSAGHTLEAASVADEAIELLRSKYEDPAGAALGALILFKTGRLQRWEGWVENLARDFPWLPDGKVLLARLRFKPDTQSEGTLQLALEASNQRMLFAESYSLLLDMLRRWDAFRENILRREAVARLAAEAPYVDWESICLCQWQPTGEA
jgi:hypothetical protein